MKRIFLGVTALLLGALLSSAEENAGGIVYGPKAAFKIDAPEGWVLDNEAGQEQGLPCVLYPKGSSWQEAKTIMYARIASPEFPEVEAFVAKAIKEMQKMHGLPKERSRPAKRAMGALISSMSIRRPKTIRSGNASLTCSCPALLPTSCCLLATRPTSKRTRPPSSKC